MSGLILSGRVGKHTNALAEELLLSSEGKTAWDADEGMLQSSLYSRDNLPYTSAENCLY